jgi:hypothetical protein
VNIAGENLMDVERFHGQHRNAIGQAVAFVQSLFVKIQCFEERYRVNGRGIRFPSSFIIVSHRINRGLCGYRFRTVLGEVKIQDFD